MFRILILGMFSLFFTDSVEAINATANQVEKKGKTKESFYYALPENYFTITVVINKIQTYKGPLADYAGKVTGLSSVVREDAVHYAISCVKIDIHSRIDVGHVYRADVSNTDNNLYHLLYKELLLSSYSNPTTSLWQEKQPLDMENTSTHRQNRFSLYKADAMIEKYDTTYIQEVFDTVVVQIPKITKRLFAKPTQQQAEEAIKTIETIREARWFLINGDHETDFSQLERMLSELQKKEDEYLALFKGITEKEELSYTFTIAPVQKGNVITLPLFQFSEKYGIGNRGEDRTKINYTLRLTSKGIHEAVEKADKKFEETKSQKNNKTSESVLYYRKPQYYLFSLYRENDLVQDFGVYPISQFGETLPLPSNVSSFEIDPLTGSLKYMEIKE
ncbi:MAG: DUF4831 family protein [Bacteroidales bacterium]|jgi:hypothetical protein|nr:DUF4831 family protein [Bacteroidales bacterium]